MHVCAHGVGKANDQLEVAANAGSVCRFLHQLQVAEGIGDCAGFLVEIRGWQDHVGQHRGLGQEHVLHDDKGVVQSFAETMPSGQSDSAPTI